MPSGTMTLYDIAFYILKKQKAGGRGRGGGMEMIRLHRLLYYIQAWSLVWTAGAETEKEAQGLFAERIEAWHNGPVIPALNRLHRQVHLPILARDVARAIPKPSISRISPDAKVIIDKVLSYYGPLDMEALDELIRTEKPWAKIRRYVEAHQAQKGQADNYHYHPLLLLISNRAILKFYGSLPNQLPQFVKPPIEAGATSTTIRLGGGREESARGLGRLWQDCRNLLARLRGT